MANKLTPKQQAFINEYLIDLNAKQAAIRAGYDGKALRQVIKQRKLDSHERTEAQMMFELLWDAVH